LIRQSRKIFGDYVLSLCQNKEIKHYALKKEEDGQLGLEHAICKRKFANLDDFVKYYQESKVGIKVFYFNQIYVKITSLGELKETRYHNIFK
jgi:hypothetical protein